MKDLDYFGKPLRWEPVRSDEPDCAEAVRQGVPLYVVLEPGDGTRYDLVVSRLARAERLPGEPMQFVVSRIQSGTHVASQLFDAEKPDASAIANGNDWSATVLAWWLSELAERVEAASNAQVPV